MIELKHQGTLRYVLTSSYTHQGFHTFIPGLLQGLKRVYILKGAPGSGKSFFIRFIGEHLSEQGYDVEFWMSALDAVSPDGVYIPQLDTAVVNGSLPLPIDPRYPGVRDVLINLEEFWNEQKIDGQQAKVIELVDQMESCLHQVTAQLQEAVAVYEVAKNIYTPCVDKKKLQDLIGELADQILQNGAVERHYFARAFTADGLVNYMNEVSAECKRRYIFKGPPGSGKGFVIEALAQQARNKGHHLEYYHCGLQPEKIDMLIIRDLQVALIKAGEMDLLLRPWDVVVDLGSFLNAYDTEELRIRHSEEIRRYEVSLWNAQQEMEKLNDASRRMQKIFTSATDFARLEARIEEVLQEIKR
ncbi:MAG TPA: hypothetical protein GX404_00640 [Syntrophomonadaceae bacterium]|nr:hypothetical protein [Syntrophomonadaceae bacterium]